jgi:hypothetical protein
MRDNTDDVGHVPPTVGVDSPKRVRYYFDSKLRSSYPCATLTERVGLSSIVLIMTVKASLHP